MAVLGMGNSRLDCLYYPFSRLLESTTLKHLLLVFDSVTFIDEAESSQWRRMLLSRMSTELEYFGTFDAMAEDYAALENRGVVRVLNPNRLDVSTSDIFAFSVLADLQDRQLMYHASQPERYNLPFRASDRYVPNLSPRPTWQIFEGKIPRRLAYNQLSDQSEWASHVISAGDDNCSWTLTYEAGTTCAVNFYLEAAQRLGLAPVTSSALHHQVVLRKLKRAAEATSRDPQTLDDEILARCRSIFTHGEVLRLFNTILPPTALARVSFREILDFREETRELRGRFLAAIDDTMRVIESDPASIAYDRHVATAIRDLEAKMRSHSLELESARDRLVPGGADALLYGTAGGGALGSAVSFLGGLSTAGIVAASALTIAGALSAKAGQYWTDRRQIVRKQDPAVSYLVSASQLRRS